MKHSVIVTVFSLLVLVSCTSSTDILSPESSQGDADWVNAASQALTQSIADPTGDFEASPTGGPPYSQPVAFSPADVTNVAFGLDENYLYVRLDYNGNIPDTPQSLSPAGEVESQMVLSQTFHLAMDTDNSDATGGTGQGVDGVDLCFALRADYGQGFQVVASQSIPAGEISMLGGQIQGEIGAGGPGSKFVFARFGLAAIDLQVFAPGATIEVGGWSEAESDLYNDMTSDSLRITSWSIPHAPVPGNGPNDVNVPFQARR